MYRMYEGYHVRSNDKVTAISGTKYPLNMRWTLQAGIASAYISVVTPSWKKNTSNTPPLFVPGIEVLQRVDLDNASISF